MRASFKNLPEDSHKILQFTDTHIYNNQQGKLLGINTLDSFKQCLERAYQQHWPADLVLATGDLSHDASPQSYRHLKNIFQNIDCDICTLPGNHDCTETLNRHLTGENIVADKCHILGNWLIVMLDSSVNGSEAGKLSQNELANIKQCLSKYPDHYIMICLHHPPIAINSAWMDTMMLQNTQDFFKLLDQYANIKIVLWGHIHQEYDSKYKGISLLASPSTCVQFLPSSKDFAVDDLPPGYRWFALHKDGSFDTGIERLDGIPDGLDHNTNGY